MHRLFRCSQSLRFLLLVAAFSGSYSLAQTPPGSRISQPIDDRVRITLKGNVHPLAQPRYDQGAAPDDLPMERMLLVLQRGPDQEAALRQLLDDQQVKSSPRFHQWLTPEEFGKQFGPACLFAALWLAVSCGGGGSIQSPSSRASSSSSFSSSATYSVLVSGTAANGIIHNTKVIVVVQ